MPWRDSAQSGFRDYVRFSFPSSSWASSSSSSFPAESGDGCNSPFPQRDDGCSYRKVVKSRCFLDHTSDGRAIKKCERTEQLLRSRVGRPQEIVESKSESTEEEVPNGWTMEGLNEEGMVPFAHDNFPRPQSTWNPFKGRDPLSRGLSDGLESFMQAAEEMMNDVFNQLGYQKQEEENPKARSGRLWKAVQDIGNEGREDNMPGEKPPPQKFDFGDSDSFDEV